MSTDPETPLCTFGTPVIEPFRTGSLCPASDAFSRIDAHELVFDLTSDKAYSDVDFPAIMCGDLALSKRGVESLHFRLPTEPGFYRIEFGFLNLTHKQVVSGDNCKYPVSNARYDGRMKEENALRYLRYHTDQLEAAHPEVVLGFDEIDEMDHQSQYARAEILLNGIEIDAFQLSSPILVRHGGNRFVPETYSRTVAVTSSLPHTLTVRTVNRPCPFRGGRMCQWGTIITEDFCPTFFAIRRAAAPSSYNAFRDESPGAAKIDLWGWEQVISYQRTDDPEMMKNGVWDYDNPMEVDLAYVEATNREAHKWGSNLIEIYWTIEHESKENHVVEWHEDDELNGAELYRRYERTIWDNDKCRALTRSCHELGMLVTWYQHIPFGGGRYIDAPAWWRDNWIELICREFADVLLSGWRGTLDIYEEESGNACDAIHWLTQSHREWQYNPGMGLGETSDARSHRHEKGLLPGGVLVETNTYFITDQFHSLQYPFEADESEYGVQSLILQANSRALGSTKSKRRGIGEIGGPATAWPDGMLQQANDFFRPAFRADARFPRTGIWWLSPTENLLPVAMRDYVYGLSNDPVRAAITADLAATGVGGVIDRATTFWTSWCQARHQHAADTRFIGNNHLRLYRASDADAGELVTEVEGLGDFSIHGPTLSIAMNPFKIRLMEGPVELKTTETVSHRYLERAGHVAKLEEQVRIDNRYLDLTIEETRRYEMLSDSPYITLEIERTTTFPEDGNLGFVQAYRNVCHSLALPGYDRLSDAAGTKADEFTLADGSLLVLEDSRGISPTLFLALVEGPAENVNVRFTADGALRVFCPPAGSQRFVFRFGVLTSWLTAEHLPSLGSKDGFAQEVGLPSDGGSVENQEPFPVIRKARVPAAGPGPYLVCERGFWTWRGAEPSRETPGDDFLKIYLDADAGAKVMPEGFIENAVKPGWGSQYQLSISEHTCPTPDGVTTRIWIRSVSAAVFAPRVRFREKVKSVLLDGDPWFYFDSEIVFLPNRLGTYELDVCYGEAETPRLLSSWGVPADFNWNGTCFSFSLDLPPFTHRLPKSVFLYGALATGGMHLRPGAAAEVVRETDDGLIFRCKPGPVAFSCDTEIR